MRRARQFLFSGLVLLIASYALTMGLHSRLAPPPFVVVNGLVLSAADFCGGHGGADASGHVECPLCRLPVADLAPEPPIALARDCIGRAVAYPAQAALSAAPRRWSSANPRAPPAV